MKISKDQEQICNFTIKIKKNSCISLVQKLTTYLATIPTIVVIFSIFVVLTISQIVLIIISH